MKPEEVFEFYRSEFLPAYSDLVGFIVQKPRQVLTETENAFSHIAQHFNPTLDERVREENIKKAYSHLMRATLDCYKLLWVEMHRDLKELYRDEKKRIFTLNISEDKFLEGYREFREKAQKARRLEMESVGMNPLSPVDKYKEAIAAGKKLMDSVDTNKAQKLKRFRIVASGKEVIFVFVIGLLTGLLANVIWSRFL